MKQLVSVALNYGKSLKSSEEDINEEKVYAECNLVSPEPKYALSNTGNPVKSLDISECELYITKESAKLMLEVFKKIHNTLVRLEKEQNK